MKIVDFNHCTLPNCRCGWNVTISGKDEKELEALRKAISELRMVTADLTCYPDKLSSEVFIEIPVTYEEVSHE